MTPDKDPQNYSVLAYLAFGGLSVWGGLVTYIQTVKREGRQFRWAEALLQVVVSGFAGMLTMLLSWYIAAPLPLCGFMAGLAGLMGSKALELYERRATGWMSGGKE
ncbi:phage holin family protein [Aeromonas veronii]|uniref:phage holin family protein n=1 Tax=Aeromonas veronii TaxID=654 RepID=UPI001D084824|nr:phage holin family protein [Aeromonas veronii]